MFHSLSAVCPSVSLESYSELNTLFTWDTIHYSHLSTNAYLYLSVVSKSYLWRTKVLCRWSVSCPNSTLKLSEESMMELILCHFESHSMWHHENTKLFLVPVTIKETSHLNLVSVLLADTVSHYFHIQLNILDQCVVVCKTPMTNASSSF